MTQYRHAPLKPLLPSTRRGFWRHGAALAGVAVLPPWARARADGSEPSRTLALVHTHTRERLGLMYAVGAEYVDGALHRLNHFLRDHYTGTVGQMDPLLFDHLHRVQVALGTASAYEVISGYRCPATNERLRATGGGGVAKQSLHTQGKAIDVRLPGVPLAELRDAAMSLQAGGVGYYPREGFVHIDTGRVRYW